MTRIWRYGPFLPFAIWVGIRAVAPAHLAVVETALGTLLLLGAIAAVSATPRRRTGSDQLLPIVVAVAFILFSLVASGDLAVTQEPVSRATGIYANGWSLQSPALNGVLAQRLFFYLPLLSLVALTVIGSLLAAAVSLLRAPGKQPGTATLGLAGVIPASIAAPAACGASLLAALGIGAAGVVGALATPLLALSALLLLGQIWRLRRAESSRSSKPADHI